MRGVNHLTFAVSDLERALAFWAGVLGLGLRKRFSNGAYLEAGPTWVALLEEKAARRTPHPDYTHTAFDVDAADFARLRDRAIAAGATIWKEDRSEGASLYVLDPDGHKLELHVGDLETRLRAMGD